MHKLKNIIPSFLLYSLSTTLNVIFSFFSFAFTLERFCDSVQNVSLLHWVPSGFLSIALSKEFYWINLLLDFDTSYRASVDMSVIITGFIIVATAHREKQIIKNAQQKGFINSNNQWPILVVYITALLSLKLQHSHLCMFSFVWKTKTTRK